MAGHRQQSKSMRQAMKPACKPMSYLTSTLQEVTQSVAVPGTPLAPGLPPFTSAELPRIPVMSYPSKQDHIAAGKSRDSSSHWPPARGGSQLGSPNLLGTWHGGSWHDSATIDVEGLPIVAKMQQRHAPDRDNSAAPSAVALGPVRSQGAISGLSVVVGQGGTARASNARAHLSRQQKPSSPPGDGNVISLSTNHKGAEPAKALNDGHLHGLPPTQHQRGWSAAHSKPGSGGREGAADRIQENAASAKLMVEVGEVGAPKRPEWRGLLDLLTILPPVSMPEICNIVQYWRSLVLAGCRGAKFPG